MEIQNPPLLETDTNESSAQAKSSRTEIFISISNSVAESNGINLSDNRLLFSQDKDSDKIVIKVVDSKTGGVIRQILPEDLLKSKKG